MGTPPRHTFELNCFMTRQGHGFAQVHFKGLDLVSEEKLEYGFLRDILRQADPIWYAHGKSIYLLGDEREIRSILNENEIETGAARLVPYKEMLDRRESVLRFLFFCALDKLMHKQGFLPSISSRQRSYYPLFDIQDGVCVAQRRASTGAEIVTKNGVVFDLDLSPDGPALLWIDAKLFTFVHFNEGALEPEQPVYMICDRMHECTDMECRPLQDGAFVSEDPEQTSPILQCSQSSGESTVAVRSKDKRCNVRVPSECVYTTVGTRELRELNVYDWWRPQSIVPAPTRHSLTWKLIGLVGEQTGTLTVPLSKDQNVIFDLQPITIQAEVRFA